MSFGTLGTYLGGGGGGGGGGGNWTADIEEATLDGDVALEKQGSSPLPSVDYAKVYSKSALPDHLLLHFDNSLTDAGTIGGTLTHPGASNGAPVYSTTTALTGSTHALHLDPVGGSDFLVIPTHADLQFDGDFTVDFWLKWGGAAFVGANQYYCPISNKQLGVLNSGLGLGLLWCGSTYVTVGRRRSFIITLAGSKPGATYCYGDFEYYGLATNPAHVSDAALVSDFHHIAICRTNGLVEMWMNGVKLLLRAATNSDGGPLELVTNATVNGDNKDYYIGREVLWNNVADSTASHPNDWNGYIDELRMFKGAAKFRRAVFTPPTGPHGGGPRTALFAMDGLGNETQVVP